MKYLLPFLLCLLSKEYLISSEGGVCKKCEIIREENKKKVNPYKYFEDYKQAEEEADSQKTKEKEEHSQ